MGRRISMNIGASERAGTRSPSRDMQVYPKQTPRSADQGPPRFQNLESSQDRICVAATAENRLVENARGELAGSRSTICRSVCRSMFSSATIVTPPRSPPDTRRQPEVPGRQKQSPLECPARSAGDARTRPAPLSLRQPASPESAQPRSGCRRPWVFPIIIFGSEVINVCGMAIRSNSSL